MSKRTIRSIQFLTDRVIADYGDGKVFQFFQKCQNGKHLRAFLNHFCPTFDLSLMDQVATIAMEKRFYNILKHGGLRKLLNREAYAFGEYLEKKFKDGKLL